MIETNGRIAMVNGGRIRWVAPAETASWQRAGYVIAEPAQDQPVAAILRPPQTKPITPPKETE